VGTDRTITVGFRHACDRYGLIKSARTEGVSPSTEWAACPAFSAGFADRHASALSEDLVRLKPDTTAATMCWDGARGALRRASPQPSAEAEPGHHEESKAL
jgi:hypothetical protein